jgi:hypothetical protein
MTDPEQPAPGEGGPGAEAVPQRLPDAPGLVMTCISLLAAKAWEALGLVPDPATKKLERNLDDAKLAIDATAALAEVIRPGASEGERREIETLVTNLRLNFVEQKNKAP